MKPAEESMQAFSRAVLNEAQAKADQILADAKAKADDIHQKAQKQAVAERAEILDRARKEAEEIRNQALAAAQLQAQTLLLERREKLLDSVFDAARGRLAAVQQWTDYGQIVRQLTVEALTRLGADAARIRADKQTQALLTDAVLAKITKETGVQVQLGTVLERGTGVIVETLDGHRQYDNTLETRLARLQNTLRSPVYHILMGESL